MAQRRTRPTSGTVVDVHGIPVTVVRKNVKNINMRVAPRGQVTVSVPRHLSQRQITQALQAQAEWITDAHARMSTVAARTTEAGEMVTEGQALWLWGVARSLRLVASPSVSVRTGLEEGGGTVELHGPVDLPPEARVEALRGFYRAVLEAEMAPRLAYWTPIVGATPTRVTVRRMRTRWGSCTPQRGTIRLALQLATQPRPMLDYVIVHELTHLLYPGHGPDFWAHVAASMPDWRQACQAASCPPGVTV